MKLVSEKDTKTLEEIRWRKENREWLKKSQAIALHILRTLREKNMSQKDLAEILEVSPQQVNKWVKGKENFRLETLVKIETALGTSFISVPKNSVNTTEVVLKNVDFQNLTEFKYTSFARNEFQKTTKDDCKIIEMKINGGEYQVAGY